jgi:His-Xaa-Ser system protein HxsD
LIDEIKSKSLKSNYLDLALSKVGNVSFFEGYAKVKFDLSLYDLESIYSAVYSMLEDSYFFFEGDNKTVIVVFFLKDNHEVKGMTLAKLALELNNRVINYSFYKIKTVENRSIKELILSKALFLSPVQDNVVQTNVSTLQSQREICDCEVGNTDDLRSISNISENGSSSVPHLNDEELEIDDFNFDDLDEICVPWEDKHDSKIMEQERAELEKKLFAKNDSDESSDKLIKKEEK